MVNKNNITEVRYSRNPRIARVLTEFVGWVRELGEGMNMYYDRIVQDNDDFAKILMKDGPLHWFVDYVKDNAHMASEAKGCC